MRRFQKKSTGLTLLETLVTIATLGILSGLSLAFLMQSKVLFQKGEVSSHWSRQRAAISREFSRAFYHALDGSVRTEETSESSVLSLTTAMDVSRGYSTDSQGYPSAQSQLLYAKKAGVLVRSDLPVEVSQSRLAPLKVTTTSERYQERPIAQDISSFQAVEQGGRIRLEVRFTEKGTAKGNRCTLSFRTPGALI